MLLIVVGLLLDLSSLTSSTSPGKLRWPPDQLGFVQPAWGKSAMIIPLCWVAKVRRGYNFSSILSGMLICMGYILDVSQTMGYPKPLICRLSAGLLCRKPWSYWVRYWENKLLPGHQTVHYLQPKKTHLKDHSPGDLPTYSNLVVNSSSVPHIAPTIQPCKSHMFGNLMVQSL